MKTNILSHLILTVVFVFGTMAMSAQTIYVHKKNGESVPYNVADLDSISLNLPEIGSDYSLLRINEVVSQPNPDWIELYNGGDKALNLGGFILQDDKGASEQWIIRANTIISAKGFLVFTNGVDFGFGLGSGGDDVVLLDAEGAKIDEVTIPAMISGQSFARSIDGAGEWSIVESPTKGASNIPLSLVINEVDGNGKFVELYNAGEEAVSLQGFTLVKNESGTWWTGGDVSVAAGGYYTIAESGASIDIPGNGEKTGAGGISPKKNVKFELKNGTGVLDEFVRSTTIELDANCTPDYGSASSKYSFGRVPDGSGDFKLTIPTCNTANGESQGDIVTN